MKKLTLKLLAAILASIALIYAVGCSSGMGKATDSAMPNTSHGGYSGSTSSGYEHTAEQFVSDDNRHSLVSGNSDNIDDTRKIIKTVRLDLETKEFDKAVGEITAVTAAAGGYVESSYITGKSLSDYGNVTRSATFVLRVPAAGLDAYVEALSGSFNVLSRQESAEDITDSYYDSKARLDSLLVQEERLLSMLEGADDLEYMLKLEDKLSEVRYQIESLYSTLQRYDKAVEMATVNVSLREVVEYQRITEPPKTFGERLHQSFTESWADFADGAQDFIVWFVYVFPTLLVIAVVIAIVVLIASGISRRRRRRKSGAGAATSEPDKSQDE